MFILQQAAQDTDQAKDKDSLHKITAEATISTLTVPKMIHALIIARAISRTIAQVGRQVSTVLVPTINMGNAAMNTTGIPIAMPMVNPTAQATTAILVRITDHRTEDAVTMNIIM